jgi:hypothetical protein
VNVTFDPLDPILLLFEIVYIVVAVWLMWLGPRMKSEWVGATLAGMGLSILGLRLLAVLPSWWLYFADGTLKWGGQGCVELDTSCLLQSLKDTVVVIQNAVVLGGFIVGFSIWQKKHPKQLAPGEAKADATGGYR